MFKYIFSFLLAITIAFQSVAFSVFADTIDVNLPETLNIEVQSSIVVDNGGMQPFGAKSWIIKKAMQAVAYALKKSISGVSDFLRSIGAPAVIVNEIQRKAIPLANALEKIARDFDYYSAITKTVITQQLQSQGFSFNVSYWVAQIVDFVTF